MKEKGQDVTHTSDDHEVEIDKIKVGHRYRKNLGDIKALANDIEDIGLLQPIGIDHDNNLVFGQRRLEAYKRLGKTHIPARVIDIDSIISGEFSENNFRKDFAPSEKVAIAMAKMNAIKEEAEKRKHDGQKKGGRVSKKEPKPGENSLVENCHEAKQGSPPKKKSGKKVRDELAAFVPGISGKTLEHAIKVVEAAEKDPEKFDHLVEEMDKTGNVNGAYRKLKSLQEEQTEASSSTTEAVYRAIFAAPPDMKSTDLNKKEIAQYVSPDVCHLYLWTTNEFLDEALKKGKKCGFTYRTILTKTLPHSELKAFFDEAMELYLFFVKDSEANTNEDIVVPDFEGQEDIHRIIEAASPPPYLDMFGKQEREGWTVLGAPKTTLVVEETKEESEDNNESEDDTSNISEEVGEVVDEDSSDDQADSENDHERSEAE